MRTIPLIIVALFLLLSGYLNLNDPDPLWWVSLYFYSAALVLYSIFKPVNSNLLLVSAVGVLLWIIKILADGGKDLEHVAITNFLHFEIFREISGLVIILVTYVFLLRGPKGQQASSILLVNWAAVALIGIYFGFFAKHYFNDSSDTRHCGGGQHF